MTELTRDESLWLKQAEDYAKSISLIPLDFADEEFWLDYKNNYGLTAEEAVDDYLSDF